MPRLQGRVMTYREWNSLLQVFVFVPSFLIEGVNGDVVFDCL